MCFENTNKVLEFESVVLKFHLLLSNTMLKNFNKGNISKKLYQNGQRKLVWGTFKIVEWC